MKTLYTVMLGLGLLLGLGSGVVSSVAPYCNPAVNATQTYCGGPYYGASNRDSSSANYAGGYCGGYYGGGYCGGGWNR